MHHHVHSQVRNHQQVNILGQPLGVVMVHPMVDQEVGAGDCLPQLLIFALSKVHMPKVPQPFVLLLPKVPFKCPLLKHTCERVSGVCGQGGTCGPVLCFPEPDTHLGDELQGVFCR